MHFRSAAVVVAFLLLFPSAHEAQSIVTVAGSSFTDEGKPATRSGLRYPTGVAVDPSGNLIVADFNANRIRRVDRATGILSTIAGNSFTGFSGDGRPGQEAELHGPSSVAVDSKGNVYFVDSGNNRVRRIDTNGKVSTVAGGGGAGTANGVPAISASLAFPLLIDVAPGIAVDADDNIFFSDTSHHLVRRIDAITDVISTVAGNGTTQPNGDGSYSGDGGSATQAGLSLPAGIAIDRSGNLYIADSRNNVIRKVELAQNRITTIAGNQTNGFSGDGLATQQSLARPRGVAVDGATIYIADTENRRVRKVSNGVMETIAGTGAGTGDQGGVSGPATTTPLEWPEGVTLGRQGELFVVDTFDYRIKRLDLTANTMVTVAGDGTGGPLLDGLPAPGASLFSPFYVVVDAAGNLIFSDRANQRIRRVDAQTGLISTVAGNGAGGFVGTFSGDNGTATAAGLHRPLGVAVDGAGNLYISDTRNNRIRKVDHETKVIRTIGGTGTAGNGDDAGSATAIAINAPRGIAVDSSGRIFFAEAENKRVRRIDQATGTMTTVASIAGNPTDVAVARTGSLYVAVPELNSIFKVEPDGSHARFAGNGTGGWSGDGSAATSARLSSPNGVSVDAAGNVFIADTGNRLIRRVDATSGIIQTVAGGGSRGFGDNGRAIDAEIGDPINVAVDATGNLFSPDSSNRIRAVFACVAVPAAQLVAPGAGAAQQRNATTFGWSKAAGAFRYDLLLDTQDPPVTPAGRDLASTSFIAANLQAGTRYFWRVVAKGDPFCPNQSAPSEVRSFSTAAECAAPGTFATTFPGDGNAAVPQTLTLTWSGSLGAVEYDVYAGSTNPPALVGTVRAATSLPVVLPSGSTKYFYQVLARSSCDRARVTATPLTSFTTAGFCQAASPFAQIAPVADSSGVASSTVLRWAPSANASSYDVYLGTSNPPPLYLSGITETKTEVAGLLRGKAYFWRVVANVACDPSRGTTTIVQQFRAGGDCPNPSAPTITFVPPGSVGVGQTYVISWNRVTDAGSDGAYLIERSTSLSFIPVMDSQLVTTTSASFIATAEGAWYHRVTALAGCDPTKAGPPSESKSVGIVTASANVVFTMQPRAVVVAPGENLEDRKTTFTLENISARTVQVLLAKNEIRSKPFFTITDPAGGNSFNVTLEPRKPKTFEVHFSGPPNDLEANYQGVIVAHAPGAAIVPYAFVNLKIGVGSTVAPRFFSGGVPTSYAAFPGKAGDDATRTPITVTIRNPGSTPLQLGAEIGPEVWLEPTDPTWNLTAIPAGSSRDVKFSTRRLQAPAGSALPRYTYLTVRTQNGESARLLVQDNDAPPHSRGRVALEPSFRSFVVPGVVSEVSSATGAAGVTQLRLSNVGSDAVRASLFFTPRDQDGFDPAQVKSVEILVPPNDVVTLTDPLVQLFGLTRPVSGQIELRSEPQKIGLLTVTSAVVREFDGERALVVLPTLGRGEGARIGTPHRLPGINSTPLEVSGVVLVETSGAANASVQLKLFDKDGVGRGTTTVEVPRYGQREIDDVAAAMGVASAEGGRLQIVVVSGGGAVVCLNKIRGRATDTTAVLVSEAESQGTSAARLWAREADDVSWAESTGSLAGIIPVVPSGPLPGRTTIVYSAMLGLSAPFGSIGLFKITFTDPSRSVRKNVEVPAGKTVEYQNVVKELFAIQEPTQGTIFVEASPGAQVYSIVRSQNGAVSGIDAAQPFIVPTSSGLTSNAPGGQRPLYLDGLSQSIDPARGTRWSLYLNEVKGASGEVVVRLFEAGNRSTPIAELTRAVTPLSQVKLDPLFASMGLDSVKPGEERSKDRTNMLLMVLGKSGSALVSATAVAIDNETGTSKTYQLTPSSGLPTPGSSVVAPIAKSPRRRGVRR